MHTILITTCTGRKKITSLPALHASTLPKGNQGEVLRNWKILVSAAPVVGTASAIYCGRGFSEILKVAQQFHCQVHIISAGLGLLSSERMIPSYNLTISPSLPESIQGRVAGTFCSSQWWQDINKGSRRPATPLADLISSNTDARFLISLSRSYAEMVGDDLDSLSDHDLERVRIFGLSRPNYLNARLKKICMPYDERFDGPDNTGIGTRSDFPQRTTCHFLKHIYRGNEKGNSLEHAKQVSEFLEGKRYPCKVERISQTDDQIRGIIQERWEQTKGASSKMLRVLRDDLLVSCEQKRFAQLFKEVKVKKT